MTYIYLFISLMFLPFVAVAQSDKADLAKIKAEIQKNLPGITISDVEATPINGLYQVSTPGAITYMSADGRYLVNGDLYDQKRGINLTDALKGKVRKARLDGLSNDDMLVYKAKGEEKQVITVFTDTSCGYCRKLHNDMPALNKEGITVRYLLYPRMGPNSASARVMESVWCADDPLQSMTDAKSNRSVPSKKCANPINEHLQIGQEFGLRGTPMIVTQTGEILPGYYPPKALKAKIGMN